MKSCTYAGWLVGVIVLLLALLAATYAWFARAAPATTAPPGPSPAGSAPANALAAADHLNIQVTDSRDQPEALLDPDAAGWKLARPTTILLSRTPRIYQTEPVQERAVPGCRVLALRSGGQLVLRLEWDDATKNAPEAPQARRGEGGDPKVLYKRPTGETSSFADAAAVMIPEHWDGPDFPSLLMGDRHAPARLYYWNASRGAEILKASGRATPQPTAKKMPCRARHADGRWMLTLEIPAPPAGYPVAVALWDGAFSDRDGLKFFSIWCVLSERGGVSP